MPDLGKIFHSISFFQFVVSLFFSFGAFLFRLGINSKKFIFDIKVVYIHPFWLRICLPYTFDYAGAFLDSLEAWKRNAVKKTVSFIYYYCFLIVLTTFFEKMSFLTFLGLETIGKRSGVVESVG